MLLYLQKEKNGRLSKFASYVQTFGAGLQGVIANIESGTIFAPNNDAFDRLSQNELDSLLGSTEGPRILGLHFIDQRIPAEDVRILRPQNDIKVKYRIRKSKFFWSFFSSSRIISITPMIRYYKTKVHNVVQNHKNHPKKSHYKK